MLKRSIWHFANGLLHEWKQYVAQQFFSIFSYRIIPFVFFSFNMIICTDIFAFWHWEGETLKQDCQISKHKVLHTIFLRIRKYHQLIDRKELHKIYWRVVYNHLNHCFCGKESDLVNFLSLSFIWICSLSNLDRKRYPAVCTIC